MKGVKYRIANNSKFSVKDSQRNIYEIISSNTIFSVIINNIQILYGQEAVEETIERFHQNSFSISSMFIGLDFYDVESEKLNNSIYFVPKPEAMVSLDKVEEDKLEESILRRKESKKIKMISLKALYEISKTWRKELEIFDFDLLKLTSIGDDFACTSEEVDSIEAATLEKLSLIKTIIEPHVSVDINTSESKNFFYHESIVFTHKNIGKLRVEPFLYFVFSGELTAEIKTALNLITDEGIGGKRSIGMGRFISNKYVDIDCIKDNKDSEIFISLSSYVPSDGEIDYLIGYKIEKVNGYIDGRPYRKRSIGRIKEGAVMSKRVSGKLVDVTPLDADIGHKVYYNGKSFCLGI